MDIPIQPSAQSPVLLEQLRDIALPSATPFWPPAPGWWILFALAIVGIALFLRFMRQRWLAVEYQREANKLLTDLYSRWQENCDDRSFAIEAHQLVRRIAIHHSGRSPIARLTGPKMIDCANEISRSALSPTTGSLLTELSYQREIHFDVEQVHGELMAWIEGLERPHRA